jgi:type II secretory pathway pseudopilin PulG
MAIELIVALAIIALAAVIILTAFLVHRRIDEPSENSGARNCREICTDEAGNVSGKCSTLCAYGWP